MLRSKFSKNLDPWCFEVFSYSDHQDNHPQYQIDIKTVQHFLSRETTKARYIEIYRKIKRGIFRDVESVYGEYLGCSGKIWSRYEQEDVDSLVQAKSALENLLKLNLDYNFIDYYNEQFQTAWRSVTGCLLDLQSRFSKAESAFREEVWNDCQKAWQQWQEVKGNENRTKKA